MGSRLVFTDAAALSRSAAHDHQTALLLYVQKSMLAVAP
jgi:hypothetical protein